MYAIASASAKASPVLGRRGVKSTSANKSDIKKAVPSRRQFVGGGLLLASVPQLPALADEGEVSYTEGPEGIRYADVTVGKGESPFEGDGRKRREVCPPFFFSIQLYLYVCFFTNIIFVFI